MIEKPRLSRGFPFGLFDFQASAFRQTFFLFGQDLQS